jgi:hypothetical protein
MSYANSTINPLIYGTKEKWFDNILKLKGNYLESVSRSLVNQVEKFSKIDNFRSRNTQYTGSTSTKRPKASETTV